MRDIRFVVDAGACSGCQLCVVACKDEHTNMEHGPWTRVQPETGHFWIKVSSMERGVQPRVKVQYLPLFCQHCDNAPCLKACPQDAIRKDQTGLVWIDADLCQGSSFCQDACPYGVIYMNDALNIAQKCTGCIHRLLENLDPRCVDICPHDAIVLQTCELDPSTSSDLEMLLPETHAAPRVLWRGLPKPYLAGTVIDPEAGEVVAQAEVIILDLFTDQVRETSTDAFGDFFIGRLEERHKYRLEVKKDLYHKAVMIVTTDTEVDVGNVELRRHIV